MSVRFSCFSGAILLSISACSPAQNADSTGIASGTAGSSGEDTAASGESLQKIFCDQVKACDCSEYSQTPNSADCEKNTGALLMSYELVVASHGLIFDEGCFKNQTQRLMGQWDCKTFDELDVITCAEKGCDFLYGDKKLGEACEFYEDGRLDNCGPDLVCDPDTTQCAAEPCQDLIKVDQPCFDKNADELIYSCEKGLYCDSLDLGTCKPEVEENQTCAGAVQCKAGLYCDEGDICQALKTADDSCANTNQCGAGLYCKDGICTAVARAEGEACLEFRCDLGLECWVDDSQENTMAICRTPEAAICDVQVLD